jgi:flavin-binding protein dodecin
MIGKRPDRLRPGWTFAFFIREIIMSVAKNSEITASSNKSFEDAVRSGIKRFSKTVQNVEGAWIKEQKVVVNGDEVTEYRVTMVVTFVLKD